MMVKQCSYISRKYPKYDALTGIDLENNMYYSLEIILNSLETKELQLYFFKIMIFDFIIGNSDRHSNNWAIIKTRGYKEYFAPIYDNGSSLCALIDEEKICEFLGKDKNKFKALVDSKSRTLIRIDGKNKKIPTHKEVLEYLCDNYYVETKDFVNMVLLKLDENKIEEILRKVRRYISHNRYLLLKKYLLEKINILDEIYRRGDYNKKY